MARKLRARQQRARQESAGGASDRATALAQLGKRGPPRRIEQRLSVMPSRREPLTSLPRTAYLASSVPIRRKQNIAAYIGFSLCVVVPVVVASIYFGLFASSQYVAEFRFSVQDMSPSTMTMPTSVPSVLGAPTGSSANNNYLVTDFLGSREAVDELQKRISVIDLYSKPAVDWWARFNRTNAIESFVPYWQSMMAANYDQVTGLATATVRAFSAEDAFLIANNMVKLSEELVNQIANRSQRDAVRFAESEVEKAQERLKVNRVKLMEYRNRVGVIDPNASVGLSNSTLIQTLRANLAQLETQFATFTSQNLTPNAPAIVSLRNQIKSTKEQLAATEADVGRGINGAALSKVIGEYEQINADVQFSQAMVTSTMQALDQARAQAAAQHLYITPYVRPSMPQTAIYPKRFWSVVTVAILSFAFWMICLLVLRSIRERFA